MGEVYIFGYARVSTKEQNLDRQLTKFQALGIPERNIFQDKESGKDFNRPDYQALRKIVRAGDLIYFDALDRLGRDFHGIIDEWKYFTQTVKCNLVCLDNEELFDSRKFRAQGALGDMMEHMFLGMLAWVADQERNKGKVRQAEGIAVAKARGQKFGRPEAKPDDRFVLAYKQWKAGLKTAAETYRELGMSPNTFYRRVKIMELQPV